VPLRETANYGVTMFFVISGYLITANAFRRWSEPGHVDVRVFYGLRIARIVPCLLLLLAVVNALALAGIAIFQNHSPAGVPISFWLVNLASLTFWMNVLIGVHGWTNYALGVLWSLSVEEVFYLSFPLLCLAFRRQARLVAFWLACIVAGPAYRFFHQGDEGGYLYAYFACFDAIAIGCCAALLARRFVWRGRARSVLTWLTALGMTFVLPVLADPGEQCVWRHSHGVRHGGVVASRAWSYGRVGDLARAHIRGARRIRQTELRALSISPHRAGLAAHDPSAFRRDGQRETGASN